MRFGTRFHNCVFCTLLVFSSPAVISAQPGQATVVEESAGEKLLEQAKADGKYTFVMFWRKFDADTMGMMKTLGESVKQHPGKAVWMHIRIDDPKEQVLVERFNATEAPLPLTFAIAPNEAMTAAIPQKLSPGQVSDAMVTPAFAKCVKAMHQGKQVLLCILPAGGQIPISVRRFHNSDAYYDKTQIVTVEAHDRKEAKLLRDLKISPETHSPVVIFIDPKMELLGRFDTAEMTVDELIAASRGEAPSNSIVTVRETKPRKQVVAQNVSLNREQRHQALLTKRVILNNGMNKLREDLMNPPGPSRPVKK